MLRSKLGSNSDHWPDKFEFLEIWPSMNESGVSVADYGMKELARIEDIVSSLEVIEEMRQVDCQAVTVSA